MPALDQWRDKLVDCPGSTRTVGILRIGFALIGWAELGNLMQPFRAEPWLSFLYFSSTFGMVLGLRARWATLVAGVTYMLILQRIPGAMHHHTYLLACSTLLLSLTPCDRSFSLDRWLALRRARLTSTAPPAEDGNLWAVRLIGLQLSAILFWGAYDKLTLGTSTLQTGFLNGDRLEQILVLYYPVPTHPPGWLALLFPLLGTSVVAFELFASVGLWLPRTRYWVLAACFFMTSSFQVFLSVGTFGCLTYLIYLTFLPPNAVHSAIDRLLEAPSKAA